MEMTDDSTYSKVVAFTAEQLRVPAHKIGPETRLCDDLGVAGDDGDIFMAEFAKRFHVDWKGFDCYLYFGSEGPDLIGCLAWMFRRLFWGKKYDVRPLTIRMLCDAVDRGTWEEPKP